MHICCILFKKKKKRKEGFCVVIFASFYNVNLVQRIENGLTHTNKPLKINETPQ